MDKELVFTKFRQYRKLFYDISRIITVVEREIGFHLFCDPSALIRSGFIHTNVFTDDNVWNECKKIADENQNIKMDDSVRDTISIQMIAPDAENAENPAYATFYAMRLTDLYQVRGVLGKAISENMDKMYVLNYQYWDAKEEENVKNGQ